MKSAPHVFIIDASHPDGQRGCFTLRCENCGTMVALRDGITVGEFREWADAFVERHSDCKRGEAHR